LLVFSKIYGIFAHDFVRFSAAVMAVLSCEGAGKKAGFRRLARFFCEKCGARVRGNSVDCCFLMILLREKFRIALVMGVLVGGFLIANCGAKLESEVCKLTAVA